MSEFKSGFVAMLGRTNVGKSTLVNLLVGEKIAATANKVQTTRTGNFTEGSARFLRGAFFLTERTKKKRQMNTVNIA